MACDTFRNIYIARKNAYAADKTNMSRRCDYLIALVKYVKCILDDGRVPTEEEARDAAYQRVLALEPVVIQQCNGFNAGNQADIDALAGLVAQLETAANATAIASHGLTAVNTAMSTIEGLKPAHG